MAPNNWAAKTLVGWLQKMGTATFFVSFSRQAGQKEITSLGKDPGQEASLCRRLADKKTGAVFGWPIAASGRCGCLPEPLTRDQIDCRQHAGVAVTAVQ